MKRQIRRGTFETNSSSTHAICISKKNVSKKDLPSHVTFSREDFGWSFGVHGDTWTKASYLYEAILTCYDDEKEEKLDHICELLAKYGISCEFAPKDRHIGYIDHGYETIDFVNEVLENEDKLITYLFGDSFVVTGNDNSDDFHDYMCGENSGWGSECLPKFNKYEIYYKGN